CTFGPTQRSERRSVYRGRRLGPCATDRRGMGAVALRRHVLDLRSQTAQYSPAGCRFGQLTRASILRRLKACEVLPTAGHLGVERIRACLEPLATRASIRWKPELVSDLLCRPRARVSGPCGVVR